MKRALTIGVFDGVHRGHRHLLQHLLNLDCELQVITFSNHPLEILHPISAPLPLTPLPLKLALLEEAGIQKTSVLDFSNDLAQLTYEEFLDQYEFDHLVLGDDAAIGRNRLGTPDALRLYGLKRNAQIHIIPKLCDQEGPISSSRIRSLVAKGDLQEAERLLGRPYCFTISRAKLHAALPPNGNYSVWAHSPAGVIPTTLTIQHNSPSLPLARISHTILREGVQDGASDLLSSGRKHCQNDKKSPEESKGDATDCADSPRECEKCGLESPQLISFGPHLNPQLFNHH